MQATAPSPTIAELRSKIERRAKSFAEFYAPGGHYEGDEYCAPNPRGGSAKTTNFKINTRRFVWQAFNEGIAGNLFDLLVYLRSGRVAGASRDDLAAARAEAMRFTGDEPGAAPLDPAEKRRRDEAAAAKRQADDKASAEDRERRRKAGLRQYLNAAPLAIGDLACDYFAGRGLDLAELPRLPRALRLSRLKHPDTGDVLHPVLLASVDNAAGFLTVHRTFLTEAIDEDGVVTVKKLFWNHPDAAQRSRAKLAYSPYRGGTIRLWRGRSGKPLARLPEDEEIVVTEGIENALACALADPERRVISALSIGNIKAIALPPQARRINLCADNDGPDAPATAARARAIAALQARGLTVRVTHMPPGIKDANDLFNADLEGNDDD